MEHLPQNRIADLLHYAKEMHKDGRKEDTIIDNIDRFTQIAKLITDINDPEQFKEGLAEIKWANSTKSTTANSYTVYLRTIGKTWRRPRYIRQEKIYFIPTEEEIDALVNSSRVLAPLLQTLKETAMRIGEAFNIEWTDIDLEQRTITINHPEKGSLPRILPLTQKCIDMIKTIPKDVLKPFARNVKHKKGLMVTFQEARQRTAERLANPRLKRITFHTFRHWKATMMFLDIHDSLEVRALLGHKTATMTDRYIHIAKALMNNKEEKWTGKVTNSTEEELNAIEEGYTLVRSINETKALYRKRK